MGRYMLIDQDLENPEAWAIPIEGKPGYFSVTDKPDFIPVSYYEIGDEVFTSYPIFQKTAS